MIKRTSILIATITKIDFSFIIELLHFYDRTELKYFHPVWSIRCKTSVSTFIHFIFNLFFFVLVLIYSAMKWSNCCSVKSVSTNIHIESETFFFKCTNIQGSEYNQPVAKLEEIKKMKDEIHWNGRCDFLTRISVGSWRCHE